jgi:hypothetical protein
MISSRLNDLARVEKSRIVCVVELPPKDPYDDDDENQEDDEEEDNGEEDDEPAVIREPDEC